MKWIKCSERMPHYNQCIIIQTTGGNVQPAYFRVFRHVIKHVDVEVFEDEDGVSFTLYPSEVTHWMPMPEPCI